MKHIHFRFITGSLALGLGFFNCLIVLWQISLLSLPQYHSLTWLWIQALGWLAAGTTLLFYGWHEIILEISFHQKRKK